MQHPTIRGAGGLLSLLALFFLVPQAAHAQSCDALTPSGGDDAPAINACLANTGRATLAAGTFSLSQPIVFPRLPGVQLRGAGNTATVLKPEYTCGQSSAFVANGQYKPIIDVTRAPNSVLRDFRLNLMNLRRDCGLRGAYAVFINKSDGVQVLNLRIKGSQFGTPEYTSGWANGGGVEVTNSASVLLRGNEIRDLGFTVEVGGQSAGANGIAIENSASARVESNIVERVAFPLSISNFSPAFGFTGDASGTTATGNTLVGAANINCPECSGGRGIKLQACGRGDELPLRSLVVRNNEARDFGGSNGRQGGSGLDLVCGVQYGTFESNRVLGASTAEFGLQVRSSFESPVNPSHHNKVDFNTFLSGRGQPGCDSSCADVNFNADGPDQNGVRRRFAGTNSARNIRFEGDRGCNDFSHAFFEYPAGQSFVNRGQSLLLAAAGTRPSTATTFRFKRMDGTQVAAFVSQSANGNCVVNQQLFPISAGQFAPGRYNLLAEYFDGNTGVFISNDPIAVIDVR